MTTYILRRLLLLPITLFFIIIVNFIIINMAPGDPVTVTEVSADGAAKRTDRAVAFGSDTRYLQFREFYGLTLPVVINLWPFTSKESVYHSLETLVNRSSLSVQEYDRLRIQFGDKSRFIMPILLGIITDPEEKESIRKMALRFFVRGGTRMAYLGADLSPEERDYNRKISAGNNFLTSLLEKNSSLDELRDWYKENESFYQFNPTFFEKIKILFETRFNKYMGRVLTLDFGTLRNDANKTVISEVSKRFKYSLTLSITPLIITFFLCQILGMIMAYKQNQWEDVSLNMVSLILYAIPIFVVAPFLIEKVALKGYFPLSGFTSPDSIYENENSYQRLFDIFQHLFLPIVAIMYGSLAASARLSRTAVLETLRQDYVRTAKAKGAPPFTIMLRHVGRNAGITIITSLAGSLGVVLGGSLIVETLFEINGFGKFFYDAVINRDYNVIMFSAIAGSFLSLLGYLAADIAYTVLDPRITLD